MCNSKFGCRIRELVQCKAIDIDLCFHLTRLERLSIDSSWMFARLRASPSTELNLSTLLSAMIDPGMMTFFLSQGAGILVERAALDALPPSWKKRRTTIAVARRVWMVLVLVLPGSLFLDSLLRNKLMTKDILDGFTPSALALMLMGKKYPVSSR